MQLLILTLAISFSADTVICSSWGSEPGHFGLYVQEELETPPMGPTSIGIGADGKLYIDDCENSRVQVFSQNGKFVKTVNKPDDIGCFWDITADRNGNVLGTAYTGRADTPAFVAMWNGRRWLRIPLPKSISQVRGATRLFGTSHGIYISFLQDGKWYSSRLTADTIRLIRSAVEGLPSPNGNIVKVGGSVAGVLNDGTPVQFSIDRMRGILRAGDDTLAVWNLSMFIDFYDDPYVVAPDGTVFVVTTSPQKLCVIRFKNARNHRDTGSVRLHEVQRKASGGNLQ